MTETTITCPVKQCEEKFTGSPAEILIDISAHYDRYHKDEPVTLEQK
jgi:hypothetical protein